MTDPLAVETELSRAVLTGDRAAAAAVLSDRFTAVGHVGNVVGKDIYLDVHFSPERQFTTFAGRDRTVLDMDGGRVVVGTFEVENAKSDDGLRTYRMTAVYAREEDGALRILAWQETPITDEDF